MTDTFKKLAAVDVNGFTEKKGKLTYLSWAHAWREVKSLCPDATYEVKHTADRDCVSRPYIHDESLGYIVETSVTIGGETNGMWLPVLDGANKSMKNEPYTYLTRSGEKTVEAATMFDINTAIMRCLTKNLAMFGLGIYIYAGEDLPIAERLTVEDAIALIEKASDEETLKNVYVNLPMEIKRDPKVVAAKDEAKDIFANNK